MTDILNVEAEILRRRRLNLLQGQEELVIMGDGRGTADRNLYDGQQRIWVRWPGSKDENGKAAIGLPFSVLSGAVNYPVEFNMQVYIKWYRDGRGYMIVGPDPQHLAATGRSMTRLNPNLPQNNYVKPRQWQAALPVPVGGMIVAVQPWIFVLDDGSYVEYSGSSASSSAVSQHIDMSLYTPLTLDKHGYAVIVFNVNEFKLGHEPLQILTSTPKSISTDLTPADIEEAIATRADLSCRPLWAYRLEQGQTTIRGHRFDRDLRSMPGGPVSIPDEFVTGDMLADDSVTAAKIAANAVGNSEIASGAVDTLEIADSAVTQAKLADASVGTAELIDGNVTNAKLAADVLFPRALTTTRAIPSGRQQVVSTFSVDTGGVLTINGLLTVTFGTYTLTGTGKITVGTNGNLNQFNA